MAPTSALQILSRRCHPYAYSLPSQRPVLMDVRCSHLNATLTVLSRRYGTSGKTPHRSLRYDQGVLAGVSISAFLALLLLIAFVIFLMRKFRLRLERQRLASPADLPFHSEHKGGTLGEKQAGQTPPPLRMDSPVLAPRTSIRKWPARFAKLKAFYPTHPSSGLHLADHVTALSSRPEERVLEPAIARPQSYRASGAGIAYDAFRRVGHSQSHQDDVGGDPAPASTPLAVQFTLPPGANQSYSSLAERDVDIARPATAQQLKPLGEQAWTDSPEPRQLVEQPEAYRRSFRPQGRMAAGLSPLASPDLATMPIPGPYLQAPPPLATFPWRIRSPRPTISSPHLHTAARGGSGRSTVCSFDSVKLKGRPDTLRPLAGILTSRVEGPAEADQLADRDSNWRATQRPRKQHRMWWERGVRLRPYQSASPLSTPLQRTDSGQASTHTAIRVSPAIETSLPPIGPRVHFYARGTIEDAGAFLQEGARTEAPKSPYVFWRDEDGDVSIPIQIAPGGRTRSSSAGSKFVEQFPDSVESSAIDTADVAGSRESAQQAEGLQSFESDSEAMDSPPSHPQAGEWLLAVTTLDDLEDSWYAALQSFDTFDELAGGDLSTLDHTGGDGTR